MYQKHPCCVADGVTTRGCKPQLAMSMLLYSVVEEG